MSKRLDKLGQKLEDWSKEEVNGMVEAKTVEPKAAPKSTTFKEWMSKHRKRQSLSNHLGKPLQVLDVQITESDQTDKEGKTIEFMDLECSDGVTYYTSSNILIKEMKEYIECGGPFPTILTARKEQRYFTFY